MKKLTKEDFSEEELQKCNSDPMYFYNKHCLIAGENMLSPEEYQKMIKHRAVTRNEIRIDQREIYRRLYPFTIVDCLPKIE